MITMVGLYRETQRKRPWLVTWWGQPEPDTAKQKKHTKTFKYRREALDFQGQKLEELRKGGFRDPPKETTLGHLFDEFGLLHDLVPFVPNTHNI